MLIDVKNAHKGTDAKRAWDYARIYSGDLPFMLNMREIVRSRAQQPKVLLTEKQVQAILRCLRQELSHPAP